ncbi:MAG: sialate O-acetylesterase [Candidatus Brocadiaceae bacterium]|jgi:sialate O-acetylesterase
MRRGWLWTVALLLGVSLCSVADAALELPSVIGENMVLQRQTGAAVWGWDEPGSTVAVRFRDEEATAQAGEDGRWSVRLPTGAAGGPFELQVRGTSERVIGNVLVGEVWVAGGQSNMWWHVSKCRDVVRVVEEADCPEVRMFDANTHPRQAGWVAEEPQRTVKARWQVTSPETVRGYPGVPYFFARELHEELDVPVGIVHLAVPATRIEPWLSRELAGAHFPHLVGYWEMRRERYPREVEEYERALEQWQERKAAAEQEGSDPPPEPDRPRNPSRRCPGALFDGMVRPVAPYATRGFLWWQGESNASEAIQYRVLFPALIQDWRRWWRQPDAPFLFVELAEFLAEQNRPVEDAPWPALRDAQHEALRLDNTAMVCTLDILEENEPLGNIHPRNKQLAGHRLFLAAMANVYGREDLVWSGPTFRSAEFDGGTVTVAFDHVGGGLVAGGGSELEGFAVAGPDREFHRANAAIVGDTVELRCEAVPQPVAARYAWANNPIGNLFNRQGLPAPPFRTDRWLLITPPVR